VTCCWYCFHCFIYSHFVQCILYWLLFTSHKFVALWSLYFAQILSM